MISSGVDIKVNKVRLKKIPNIAKTIPPTKPIKMDVCTARLVFFSSCPPSSLATMTLAPTLKPLKTDVSKKTIEPVAPTAANAVSPTNLPTTIVSAALKSICKKLVNIKGTAKINRFFNFLESQAANLDLEDPNPVVENTQAETSTAPVDLLNKTDNIEMLDDFVIPDNPTDNSASNNDYLSNVIKTVRSLNFDSDKVVIEEMNLPTEYHITIKIKKDKI